MEIKNSAVAGTLESCDIMITLRENAPEGIQIDLNSVVEQQFGAQIKKVIAENLAEMGIEHAHITAIDKGALDCTIKARMKTVLYRACLCEEYRWEDKQR